MYGKNQEVDVSCHRPCYEGIIHSKKRSRKNKVKMSNDMVKIYHKKGDGQIGEA